MKVSAQAMVNEVAVRSTAMGGPGAGGTGTGADLPLGFGVITVVVVVVVLVASAACSGVVDMIGIVVSPGGVGLVEAGVVTGLVSGFFDDDDPK